jgi:polyphosphate kinase 2 (PPK2 family)
LVERVEGYATPTERRRAYNEINEFERMLLEGRHAAGEDLPTPHAGGTDGSVPRPADDPPKRWRLSYEDFRNHGWWKDHETAIEDMMSEVI